MTALETVEAALRHSQATSPRSLQVKSGASNAGECRAASVLRLTGTPPSDPEHDVSLPSLWGTAWHSMVEGALRAYDPSLIVEQKLRYRGVPCTVDVVSPKGKWLGDHKGCEKGALAVMRRENRPKSEGHRMQVHLGAAAAIEAGYEVDTVCLLYVPRDGRSLDDCWEWSEPFNRALADAAADDVIGRDELAAEILASAAVLEDGIAEHLEGLRDEPLSFCRAYCVHVTTCRGEGEPDTTDPDPEQLDAAQRYVAARLEADEATARRDYYRDLLDGAPPIVTEGWKVAWSGGREKVAEVVDDAAVRSAYEFVIGPLPTREVVSQTARSLRATKVRGK